MLIRKLLLLLAVGSPALLLGTTVGLNQTTCTSASLASYVALGSGGCFVNGVLYNNFSFLVGFSNGATPTPTAADILLAPDLASGAIDFAYPVATRNYVSFALQYDFDPPPVEVSTIDLDVTGDVDIFESICPGGRFLNTANGCFGQLGDTSPVNLEVFNQHLGATRLTDSAVINPPATNGEVQLYFVLNGLPGAPASFDALTSTLNAAAPEPKTFALLFGGLLLMAGARLSASRRAPRK